MKTSLINVQFYYNSLFFKLSTNVTEIAFSKYIDSLTKKKYIKRNPVTKELYNYLTGQFLGVSLFLLHHVIIHKVTHCGEQNKNASLRVYLFD
jgi:hypothetical protein